MYTQILTSDRKILDIRKDLPYHSISFNYEQSFGFLLDNTPFQNFQMYYCSMFKCMVERKRLCLRGYCPDEVEVFLNPTWADLAYNLLGSGEVATIFSDYRPKIRIASSGKWVITVHHCYFSIMHASNFLTPLVFEE